jgi:hypothetical protein
MKIPGRFVLLFTLLLALAACASDGIADDAIAGTYLVTLTKEQLSDAGASFMLATGAPGTYQLELTNDGIARFSQATDIGLRLRAEGPYTLFEHEIRFGADSGDYACTKYGVEQSSYKWVLKDGQLRLTVIEDDCDDRRFVYITQPWVRQP